MAAAAMNKVHLQEDRRRKYGFGAIRLGALVVACAWRARTTLTASYWLSVRCALHVWCGAVGAVINTSQLPFAANVAILVASLAWLVCDAAASGSATAWYLLKTTAGDTLAGKVDTPEWRLGLGVIAAAAAAAAAWVLASPPPETEPVDGDGSAAVVIAASVAAHARVFCVLAAVQFVCEFGDARLEALTFFRHRYSYEALTAGVLALVPLAEHERRVAEIDLVCCLSYRVFNFLLIAARGFRAPALATLLFKLFGLLHHPLSRRYVRVTDPRLAALVLKGVCKGDGVESRIATPAWAPVFSLESVDGELWRSMRRDFARLHEVLAPRAATLAAITERRTDELLALGGAVDARAVTRLTLSIFLELLFGGRDWNAELDVIANASWEWRREIACKGKGSDDAKAAAVAATLGLLRADDELWGVFGDDWTDPRRFSLVLQPFLISPAINTCDIMVAVQRAGKHVSLDDAIRAAHPFPILERFVDKPLCWDDGRVAVAGGTHVLLFAEDFRTAPGWGPVFSVGRRACAGAHFARAYLPVLRERLLGHPLFRPEDNHLWSGRDNDGGLELDEALYFARTVFRAVFLSGALKQSD